VLSNELELDVPGEYKTAVKQMVDDYKPSDVKLTCPVKMTIITNCTNIAFREHPSRSSAAEREIIQKQLEEWLQLGIVRASCSDVASKVVLAKKRDKTYRLCIDDRILNTKVLKDRFPVPLIDEVLDKMQNAKYFSVFDLKNGFFHVEIDEASRKANEAVRDQRGSI